MAAQLPQPGIEVIQSFSTTSPTVITPTLVPCVVGVCRQVVDVLTQTATGAKALNSQALVPVQAMALATAAEGSPPAYSSLDGLVLALSLNNGPAFDITFVGTSLTPAQVVAEVLEAFSSNGIAAFTAGVTESGTSWYINSLAANAFQTIKVLGASAPAVLAAFGFGSNKVYAGSAGYNQSALYIPTSSYPDPNKNLSQLVIDPATVEAFLFLGGSGTALLQLLPTTSFLENGVGTGPAVVGSVSMEGLTYATAAAVVGTVDMTTSGLYGGGGTLDGETLIINVNSAGPLTLALSGAGNTANEAALLAAIAAEWPTLTVTTAPSTHYLTLTDKVLGLVAGITIGAGTANTHLGLTAATTHGTAGTLDGLTLIETFNGGAPLTVTFAPAANAAATVAQVNAVISAVGLATEASGTHYLTITDLSLGPIASILDGGGTADSALGIAPGTVYGVAGVQAISNGSGSALTTLLNFPGVNFTASPTAAVVTGTVDISAGVADGLTLTLYDGNAQQTVTFASASTGTLVVAQVNALFGSSAGGSTLASLSTNHLVLTNTTLGVTSIMQVVGGTGLTALGLTATTVRGAPFAPLPGDMLWVSGASYATITGVAPGGNTSQLQIDTAVPVSNNVGNSWYIIAAGLSASATNAGVTRPYPNLIVDGYGNITIKPEVLRNTLGNPVYPASPQVYVQYEALRLDVTAMASSPGLLSFSDTTTLTANLGPITTANPLGLGFYFALLNAPATTVVGIGVDAYTESAPFGTVEAFTRAATFLEGFEVYAIVPLTHDTSVFQVFQTHVDTMSLPANQGERLVIVNPTVPTTYLNALVASGIDGNTTETSNQFDTGIHGIDALLLAQGLPPAGPYLVTDGVFLDIGDGNNYSVTDAVGSILTIKTSGFLPGQNSDGFYATTSFPTTLISETFALYVRGAELVLPDGTPDLANIAVTMQQMGRAYGDRRVWVTSPDTVKATLNGIQQNIDGFYFNAAYAGAMAQQPPQQSFTNFPITGFTGITSLPFNKSALNVMAAGGVTVISQTAPGTPLFARMALTTDMTSVETRTDSITKVVDFVAKFLRSSLSSFIGRFNITQGFLDSLGHVIQGLLQFLTDSGVLIGSNLNNIIQDTSEPDTVDVDVTLDVPYPCNYIRLTLSV